MSAFTHADGEPFQGAFFYSDREMRWTLAFTDAYGEQIQGYASDANTAPAISGRPRAPEMMRTANR